LGITPGGGDGIWRGLDPARQRTKVLDTAFLRLFALLSRVSREGAVKVCGYFFGQKAKLFNSFVAGPGNGDFDHDAALVHEDPVGSRGLSEHTFKSNFRD
jgi:hypothetical protein